MKSRDASASKNSTFKHQSLIWGSQRFCITVGEVAAAVSDSQYTQGLSLCVPLCAHDLHSTLTSYVKDTPVLRQHYASSMPVLRQRYTSAQCPRCQIGCSCSKSLSAVTTGGSYAPVDTTSNIGKSSFSSYWNKLSSISNIKNMLQVVATGA